MLCPGCGTNVGIKLQYCDQCKSLEQVRVVNKAEEKKAEPVIEEAQETNVPLQEVFDEATNPGIGKIEKLFFALAFIAVILSIGTILYYKGFFSKSKIPEIIEISHDSSSYISAGKKVDLLSNIALYDSKQEVLEIAFFDGNLSSINKEILKSLDSLSHIPNSKPDLVLSLKFKNNTKDCNISNVSNAKLILLKFDNQIPLTEVPLEFNNLNFNTNTAFGTLNCVFTEKEILKGQFKISLKQEGDTINFDLKSQVRLLVK